MRIEAPGSGRVVVKLIDFGHDARCVKRVDRRKPDRRPEPRRTDACPAFIEKRAHLVLSDWALRAGIEMPPICDPFGLVDQFPRVHGVSMRFRYFEQWYENAVKKLRAS